MIVGYAAFLLIALFAFVSGVNDGGNLVASFLSAGTLRGPVIVPLLLVSIGLGPVVFGTAVAHTIAIEVVNFSRTGFVILDVALLAALLTLFVTWRLRIPTSTTVALVGGMVGAAMIHQGGAIRWSGVLKVMAGIPGAVMAGFVAAYLLTKMFWWILGQSSREQGHRLSQVQYATAFLQGLAYGANDQEKAIGLTALALAMLHPGVPYVVTPVAIAFPLVCWAAGLWLGGGRIAQTVGTHVFRLRPANAVSTQAAAGIAVMASALVGFPVSTTQTTDGSLFGMGAALAPRRVRWRTVGRILAVWGGTMPIAAFFAWASMSLVDWIRILAS